MKYKDYTGACDGLIKTMYHVINTINQDKEWTLRMTEKQRTILLRMARKVCDTLENDVVIIPEKPPQKVLVSIKKK